MADYDPSRSRATIPELFDEPAALGELVETILTAVLDAQLRDRGKLYCAWVFSRCA